MYISSCDLVILCNHCSAMSITSHLLLISQSTMSLRSFLFQLAPIPPLQCISLYLISCKHCSAMSAISHQLLISSFNNVFDHVPFIMHPYHLSLAFSAFFAMYFTPCHLLLFFYHSTSSSYFLQSLQYTSITSYLLLILFIPQCL